MDADQKEDEVSLRADARPPRLSVVVPIHNEAATLGGFLDELTDEMTRTFLDGFEIVAVDDASTDGSDLILTRHRYGDGGASNGLPPAILRLRRLSVRGGSGAARRLGSGLARGELVAWIDADGTYVAADLVRLVASLGEADQVIGARPCDHGRFARAKFFIKRLTARAVGALWGENLPDLNSGLRVFRRAALLAWLDQVPDGFSCTSTATLAALNAGQRVRFAPIAYRPRPAGSKSKFRTLADSTRLIAAVGRQWQRRRPPRAKRA